MFRLWGKIWKDNRLLRDTVICDDSQDTRTHKIFRGLESVCYEMDLEILSGWIPLSRISKNMTKPDFIRITSLNRLILTIWRSRL